MILSRQQGRLRAGLDVIPGLIIICVVFAVGFIVHKDYGITWDEVSQQNIGATNLKFIKSLDAGIIDNFWDRDHGAWFEVLLVCVQRAAEVSDMHDVFQFRHICTFTFFLVGIFFGYLLILRLYGQQWLALVGLTMLLLQPRFFAHAFFNSKDIPFLAAFLIALYAICVAFEGSRNSKYLLAGTACGITTGIRLLGGLLIVLTIALLIADYIHYSTDRKRIRYRLTLFLGSSITALYFTWPTLWYHPIDNLVGSLKSLSQFNRFDTNVLFQGKMLYCTALPWYYAPVWICISTPLVWLSICISGFCLVLYHFVKRPVTILQNPHRQMLLLCTACVLVPLLTIIILHSVVYDDWRHLYFIYPPFVIIGLYALDRIGRLRIGKVLALVTVAIQSIVTTDVMIREHPFQQVYFNSLVSHSPEYLRRQYDLEYWGASYKQGFEYLLVHDGRDSIPVVKIHTPLMDNWLALPEEFKGRIRWANESEKGAYIMTNYRVHPDDYPYHKIWGITREGSTIMQIYQID